MGQRYRQLSLEERCALARLHGEGQAIRQIAAIMGRSASSIARELKRNRSKHKGYEPSYASMQARARRWKGSRLERQPGLREQVLGYLAMGCSPQATAGRLALEHGNPVISHESIYRFIYAQLRRSNDKAWRHYLPQAKGKRGYRRRKGRGFVQLPGRVSIHERPESVATRKEPGHWEADLMCFAKGTDALLIAHERTSRLLMATVIHSKAAGPVADNLNAMLAPLHSALRKTITFDNGAEFARHQRLPLQAFFCDPHSPWQKGGIENAIGRLRRFLPRKTSLSDITKNDVIAITRHYNHTPRKCLGFKTPAEAFLIQLLHFKCESTPRLKRA